MPAAYNSGAAKRVHNVSVSSGPDYEPAPLEID